MKFKYLLFCLLPLCGLVSCNKGKTGDIEFAFDTTVKKGEKTTLSFTLAPGSGIYSSPDSYHVDIDWGDGKSTTLTEENFKSDDDEIALALNEHSYDKANNYQIKIHGQIAGFSFSDDDGKMLSDDNINTDKFVLNTIEKVGSGDMYRVKLGGFDSSEDKNVSKMSDVRINSPLSNLYENMFANTSLKTVNLPSSLIEIKADKYDEGLLVRAGDFSGLETLQTINIPNDNHITIIEDGAFKGCSALTNFTVPKYITELGKELFSGCTSLKDFVVPNYVTLLDDEIFNGCESLESFTFPSSVTTIGSKAFLGCKKIETLKFERTTPPTITNDTFDQNYTPKKIIVPKKCKDAYKENFTGKVSDAFLEKIVEE